MRGLLGELIQDLALNDVAGTHSRLSRASRVSACLCLHRRGHLLNLALVLEMVHVVFVEVFLCHDGLLIEESFGKCVVLALDPLSLTLAHPEIQTCGLVDARLGRSLALAALGRRGRRH